MVKNGGAIQEISSKESRTYGRDDGRTDGHTDRRTDSNIPPSLYLYRAGGRELGGGDKKSSARDKSGIKGDRTGWQTDRRTHRQMDEMIPTCSSYIERIAVSSLQSPDRLGRRGDMRDDSAEILFRSFLQEAIVRLEEDLC